MLQTAPAKKFPHISPCKATGGFSGLVSMLGSRFSLSKLSILLPLAKYPDFDPSGSEQPPQVGTQPQDPKVCWNPPYSPPRPARWCFLPHRPNPHPPPRTHYHVPSSPRPASQETANTAAAAAEDPSAPQTNSEAEESNFHSPASQAAEPNNGQEKEPEAAEAAELQSVQEAKQSKNEKDINSSSEADNQPPKPKVGVDPH